MRVGAISFLPCAASQQDLRPNHCTASNPHHPFIIAARSPQLLFFSSQFCEALFAVIIAAQSPQLLFFPLNFVRHYSDHHQSISCRIFWQLLCYFVKVEDSQPSSSQSVVGVSKLNLGIAIKLIHLNLVLLLFNTISAVVVTIPEVDNMNATIFKRI